MSRLLLPLQQDLPIMSCVKPKGRATDVTREMQSVNERDKKSYRKNWKDTRRSEEHGKQCA